MADRIKLAIASDLSGFPLKSELVKHLAEKHPEIEVIDFGIPDPERAEPYYVQAPKVAKAIQRGEAERGVLICGTGQGMAIVANKHKGVYACVAADVFAGERGKIVNNANVLTMGGWITAPFLGTQILDSWLSVAFCEKMEFKREWLTNAYHKVEELEKENFK